MPAALLMMLLLFGVLSPAGALLAGAAVSPTDRAKNFWILCGRDGVPPAGSLELCKDILNAQRAGEAVAMEQAMIRLGDLPVAVEMAAAADGGRRFALPAPDNEQAASRGGLLEFSELSFGEGGHGSKTWPAGVALSIWTQRDSVVKVPPSAAPQLGSCAASRRAWWFWAARHSQEEAGPLGAQPPPRVLELAASKAAHFKAADHTLGATHSLCMGSASWSSARGSASPA